MARKFNILSNLQKKGVMHFQDMIIILKFLTEIMVNLYINYFSTNNIFVEHSFK